MQLGKNADVKPLDSSVARAVYRLLWVRSFSAKAGDDCHKRPSTARCTCAWLDTSRTDHQL